MSLLAFLLKVLLWSLGLALGIKALAPQLSEVLLALPTTKLNVLALLTISLPVLTLAVLLQVRILHKLQ